MNVEVAIAGQRSAAPHGYRPKRDNLSALREDNAHDAFLSWFVTMNSSVTGAYVDLGNIATHPEQRGWYLVLQTCL